jgi:hypothetical protein
VVLERDGAPEPCSRALADEVSGLADADPIVLSSDDARDHVQDAERLAVDLVVEVDLTCHALDQLELGLEAGVLSHHHPRLGDDDDATLGAVQVALEVLVRGVRRHGDLGVHFVGDGDGVGEGAVGLDAREAALLGLHVHDDVLEALGGQHAEAQVYGIGDPPALAHADPGLDALIDLVDVDLEAGDQVRADDLAAVHLQVRDVVALDVAGAAEAGEQLARRLDLVRGGGAHQDTAAISASSGSFSCPQVPHLSPK